MKHCPVIALLTAAPAFAQTQDHPALDAGAGHARAGDSSHAVGQIKPTDSEARTVTMPG